jgi:MoaA/NifB/PqqE/SkfB family radical SAM enzyme
VSVYKLQDRSKFTALVSRTRNPDEIVAEVKGPAFLAYRERWKRVSDMQEVSAYPTHLVFELNHSCNMRCPMCTWSADVNENQGKEGWFPFERYAAIVEDGVRRGLCSVALNAINEPLLRPDLPRFVAHARDAGVLDIIIHTNGMLLTETMARGLIASGLTKLMVSLDAVSQPTYDRIRVGGSLPRVKKNIGRFLALRRELQAIIPVLCVNFVKMSVNEAELEAFMAEWTGVADYIAVQEYMNPFPDAEKGLAPTATYQPHPEFKCSHPWQRMKIASSGTVYPCCSFYADEHVNLLRDGRSSGADIVIGNVNERPVETLWTSPTMTALRTLHAEGRFDDHPVCRQCVRNSVLKDVE